MASWEVSGRPAFSAIPVRGGRSQPWGLRTRFAGHCRSVRLLFCRGRAAAGVVSCRDSSLDIRKIAKDVIRKFSRFMPQTSPLIGVLFHSCRKNGTNILRKVKVSSPAPHRCACAGGGNRTGFGTNRSVLEKWPPHACIPATPRRSRNTRLWPGDVAHRTQ